MVSGRLARSRKSGARGPEVVNEKFDKELNREMDGFGAELGNLALEAQR